MCRRRRGRLPGLGVVQGLHAVLEEVLDLVGHEEEAAPQDQRVERVGMLLRVRDGQRGPPRAAQDAAPAVHAQVAPQRLDVRNEVGGVVGVDRSGPVVRRVGRRPVAASLVERADPVGLRVEEAPAREHTSPDVVDRRPSPRVRSRRRRTPEKRAPRRGRGGASVGRRSRDASLAAAAAAAPRSAFARDRGPVSARRRCVTASPSLRTSPVAAAASPRTSPAAASPRAPVAADQPRRASSLEPRAPPLPGQSPRPLPVARPVPVSPRGRPPRVRAAAGAGPSVEEEDRRAVGVS